MTSSHMKTWHHMSWPVMSWHMKYWHMTLYVMTYKIKSKFNIQNSKFKFHNSKFNSNQIKMKTIPQMKTNQKQAGAELCQALGKLNLFWPWLDPCLLWLAKHGFGLPIWLINFTKFESKVFNLNWLYPLCLVEVSESKRNIGSANCFG